MLPTLPQHMREMIANQSLYREIYVAQQKQLTKEKNKIMNDKKYYGNSSEYKKLWYKIGAQGFNK